MNEGDHDYAVVGDFATGADLRTYADEEGHLALLTDLIRPNIASRADRADGTSASIEVTCLPRQ